MCIRDRYMGNQQKKTNNNNNYFKRIKFTMEEECCMDDDMGLFADDFELIKNCCDYDEYIDQEVLVQQLFDDAELAWVDENGVVHFYPAERLGKYYQEFCVNDNIVKDMTDDQITETVQQYTDHESKYYRKLNLFLASDNKELTTYALFTNKLNYSIRHLACYHPVTVPTCYRGIHCSAYEMEHYQQNQTIYIPSFLSASQSLEHVYSESQNTLFVIILNEIPNNAFTVIQKYSPFAETEHEALFSAYSKFRIKEKSQNKNICGKVYEYYLVLEHINEGKKLELKVPIEKDSSDYSLKLSKLQYPPLYKLQPYQFIHVLDKTTNLTRIEFGPQNYVEQPNEKVINSVQNMISLPLKSYCMINNPVQIINEDKYQFENLFGRNQLKVAEKLTDCQPFPLYPNESIQGNVQRMMVVESGQMLKIQQLDDWEGKKVGEQWLIKGPLVYYPNLHEKVITIINTFIMKPLQALKVKAIQDMTDCQGIERVAGELWLIRNRQSYLPQVNEQLLCVVTAKILTETVALHLKATNNFTDIYGIQRKTGEQWLLTYETSPYHILDIYEELIKEIELTVIGRLKYCIIKNPYDKEKKRNLIGRLVIKEGPCAFFLYPGEEILQIEEKIILQADEACTFQIKEPLEIKLPDQKIKKLKTGETLRLFGPQQLIIPLEAEEPSFQNKVLLSKTQGIYIRNVSTGQIKTIKGTSYLLQIDEEFYTDYKIPAQIKHLIPPVVEQYNMITNYCPFNHAVQIYDFNKKDSMVVIGPKFTCLEPQQQFTVISVSGGIPKKPFFETFINICLGPNFITDQVTVETADHALLDINICYQVKFQIDQNSSNEEKNKIFKVKDYVADLCYQIASITRSATSQISFEEFHKSSAQYIQKAIFGNEKEKILPLNNLVIQNVDIQSIEPIDKQISQNLEKNVALAIQITTNRQEANAMHEAEVLDQQAQQLIEQQIILDQQQIQQYKLNLFELQAESKRILSQSHEVSTIIAKQEKIKIEMNTKLQAIELKMKSQGIRFKQSLNSLSSKSKIQLQHEQLKNEIELEKLKKLSEIESQKIDKMTKILGQEVLQALQQLEPLTKQKLVQSLGIKANILFNSEDNLYCLTS
eukprot:TRINITY_DN434_c0_g1_i3.p1 TRINITY_DN434_c0_g1~~TRINITY_DN434_c0_g1_i3.p1  ORF type:complete len:1103 (+),score=209.21 TRINITY_DN434_c0_g1_i3:125-3433(+)